MKLLSEETLGLQQNYYWNSQSSTSIVKGKSEYFATRKFTEEELPVGTVIEIDFGWFYRPERWVNDKAGASRPNNVSTYRVIITEDFWSEADNSTYRAFNITSFEKTKYTSSDTGIAASAFRIYVPEASTLY